MNRRTFLQTAAIAVSATSGLSAQVPVAMPKPAKITSSVMLWTLPGTFAERIQIAARSGIQSVELVDEHIQWSAAQIVESKKLVRSFGLNWDTIIATPNWKNRPVSMVDPAQRGNFLADVKQAVDFARKMEIKQLILISGDEIPGRTRQEQYASMLEGCKRAGDLAAAADVTLIIEPLNSKVDHKGVFLTNCVEGLKLVKETDNPNFRLLFDIYHEQVQMGTVMETITAAAPFVAVFHIADAPGRHEPGTGSMDYAPIYRTIQKTGYGGYICMEYRPTQPPVNSLIKAVDGMRSGIAA